MPTFSHKHIYISEAQVEFHQDSLEHFISQYTPMTRELEITGFIAYRRKIFFHLLEGSEDKIDILMDYLRRDDRHKVLKELVAPPTKTRIFPKWHMKQIVDLEHASIPADHRLHIQNYWDTMLSPRML